MSGIASWNKCYKNWRVFAPFTGASFGERAEAAYLHSASSLPIPATSAVKKSGHDLGLPHDTSLSLRPIETDTVRL